MKILLAFALVAAVAALPRPEPVEVADEHFKVSPVNVVSLNFAEVPENNEVAADVAEEILPSAVKFVDIAENSEAKAPEVANEEVEVSAVKVVPLNFEDVDKYAKDAAEESVADVAEEIIPSPVRFVDIAENSDAKASEVAADEQIVISAVKVVPLVFVDVADAPQIAAEEILPSPVKFVDDAVNEIAAEAENVLPSRVKVVSLDDLLPLADFVLPADNAEEIPASPVKFVDSPVLSMARNEVPAPIDISMLR